jgi:hypothetical protein
VKCDRYTSDELTHFVGSQCPSGDDRYKLLLKILRTGKLRASGATGTSDDTDGLLTIVGNQKISDGTAIQGVIVCFCDIPLPSLGLHMRKYKCFGIAFPKPFLVAKGANPVFYVVNDATLPGITVGPAESGSLEPEANTTRGELMDRIHSEAMELSTKTREMMAGSDNPDLQRLLWRVDCLRRLLYQTTFAFVKPFNSAEPEDSNKNYYMEREWRVYGEVLFDMSDVHRIILPASYGDRFLQDCPDYHGELELVSERDESGHLYT